MARDADWVAPKDAQVGIIKKWQEWYARSGHTYRYVNDRNLDDWYFQILGVVSSVKSSRRCRARK